MSKKINIIFTIILFACFLMGLVFMIWYSLLYDTNKIPTYMLYYFGILGTIGFVWGIINGAIYTYKDLME